MSEAFTHAGHWPVNAAYLAPLTLLIGVILWGKLNERRAKEAGPEA